LVSDQVIAEMSWILFFVAQRIDISESLLWPPQRQIILECIFCILYCC